MTVEQLQERADVIRRELDELDREANRVYEVQRTAPDVERPPESPIVNPFGAYQAYMQRLYANPQPYRSPYLYVATEIHDLDGIVDEGPWYND